ncbi:TPA: DUF1642 domain-containing protein [Streptococcus suis]|uniref:DUF1642 domain-containing protein n=1 Tax=Streptococcus suis TaxID=1307 RepID=UPI000405E6F8|nr:DUF1642 domain-containing protein [Streptococcus suis]HEL1569399.1 DUF1642 domain-containing protein [Streptococcus suis]HEL2560138.1 DUF1642 domain-containing protein [Streptococcus suis]HEL2613044.1 DUF1642 domain-containing protein [Streptococcus suis]HEL2640557.1 DUF1642 domain-containing protein [Streptococcus suis]HEM2564846.1 DUF1642 domain-containing protein [Streptococcus suis]
MNKQEAKQKLHNIAFAKMNARPDDLKLADVMQVIDQIHEPQKVVVPKFVAEWIESHKESFSDASAIDMYDNLTSDNRSGYYHEVWLWVIAHHHDFIKAWHDGYEIEQEKLCTVEIPNNGGTLVLASIHHAIKLVDGNKHFPGKFTKESIEYAGFGWVFDCDGVKVVEVSDEV